MILNIFTHPAFLCCLCLIQSPGHILVGIEMLCLDGLTEMAAQSKLHLNYAHFTHNLLSVVDAVACRRHFLNFVKPLEATECSLNKRL